MKKDKRKQVREGLIQVNLPNDITSILQSKADEVNRSRKNYIEYILINHAKEIERALTPVS